MTGPVDGGFFGKLPSRGDFVGAGLPAPTVDAFDRWAAAGMHASQAALGAQFEAVWEQAPHWLFALPVGCVHAHAAACGVWVPSVDRTGRCFPLLLVALHAQEVSVALEPLEALGHAAVRDGLEPEALEARLAQVLAHAAPAPSAGFGWWREGARLAATLPEGDAFLDLLRPRTG